jgi:hypothetical protein
LRGKATFALVKGNNLKKDSPEGTKAKLQIEGRATTAIARVFENTELRDTGLDWITGLGHVTVLLFR